MPIPRSSIGECDPEVTSPPSAIAIPWRGMPASCITKATSFRSGPSALIRRSSSAPMKSVSSAHTQPRPGGDRVGVRPDVVAVQRVADLEPQRVPRAEAAGRGAALEDGVPERGGVLGHRHQLDTGLARVARAVDHHLDPVELAHLERERRRVGEAEPLERARPLDGEQRVLVGHVPHVRARGARDP